MEASQPPSSPAIVSELLQAGIAAVRAGQKDWAHELLSRAVEMDEGCASAWLWLSDVAESPEEKEHCLEQVLRIEPDHDMARRGLARLRARRDPPQPPTTPKADPGDAGVPRSQPPVEDVFEQPAYPVELESDHLPEWRPGDGPQQPSMGPRPGAGSYVPPILDVDAMLQEGIDAVYANQVERARDLLSRVVEVNERHMSAWLWLSYVSDSQQERDRCVARVLSLAGQDTVPLAAMAASPAASLAAAVAAPFPGLGRPRSRPAGRETSGTEPGPSPIEAVRNLATRVVQRPVYAGAPTSPGGYVPPEAPFFRVLAVEASAASLLLRRAVSEWATTWGLTALAYLAGITVAEVLTTFAQPEVGLVAHSLVLLALLVHSSRITGREQRAFVLSLALAPLIRILSLSLPLIDFPLLYWYLLTSIPLFAAAMVAARSLSYTWRDLGLHLRGWPLQIGIGLTGLLFGCVEYYILRPDLLATGIDWRSLAWAALILIVSTGLLEELIFRGLLQRAAGDALGRWGLTYVALLFAILHVGYKSAADLIFVFVVGLFLGWIVQRTRSLLGVTLAHGMTNVVLFLVMPLLQL